MCQVSKTVGRRRDLSRNQFNGIAPRAFDSLVSVETLDLSFNHLLVFSPKTFSRMSAIQVLCVLHVCVLQVV